MPSFVLKSNLARRCCLMVALISARLTNKLIPMVTKGHINEISQTCKGKEAKNSYGIVDELRFDLRNNWLYRIWANNKAMDVRTHLWFVVGLLCQIR